MILGYIFSIYARIYRRIRQHLKDKSDRMKCGALSTILMHNHSHLYTISILLRQRMIILCSVRYLDKTRRHMTSLCCSRQNTEDQELHYITMLNKYKLKFLISEGFLPQWYNQ